MQTRFSTQIILALVGLSMGIGQVGDAGDGLGSLFGRSEREPIAWLETETAVLNAARQASRPLLIYATSTNCTFCRKMERETWSDPQVVGVVKSEFIPFRITPETHPELIERLRVRGFPTTVIIAPGGYTFPQLQGYVSQDRLLAVFEDVRERQVALQDADHSKSAQ
ncbi:MAG: thioredoxin family protein [Planctomycetaceae bacterium]